MVKIRLKRVGATKRPSYRIVAAEAWGPRDGRFLETLGHYNPLSNPATVVINEDKLNAWLQNGAEPTETVVRILLRTGVALPDRVKSIVKVHGTKKQALKEQATAAAATAATAAAATAATAAAAATAAQRPLPQQPVLPPPRQLQRLKPQPQKLNPPLRRR